MEYFLFRLRCQWAYWFGKFFKEIFGVCRCCLTRLNITRYGQGVCPKCSRRY